MYRRGWEFPGLRSTLYSGTLGCAPNSFVTVSTMYLAFGTLDPMWSAFPSLANNKTQAINSENNICLLRRGPGPPIMGAARDGRHPSRLHDRRHRANIRLP